METMEVYNAAKPDWCCPYCNTRHGTDRDAAERCFAAGPPDDRGPLAVFDGIRLRVVEPSSAAPFTHEVLYGRTPASSFTQPYPFVNMVSGVQQELSGDLSYTRGIGEVPIEGVDYVEASRRRHFEPLPQVRELSVPRHDGWFGPLGDDGVAVLVAAQSHLPKVRPVVGGHTASSMGNYPYFDSGLKRSSTSRPWPDAYRVVAEAATGSTHEVELVRWLHHHGTAVGEWLAARFVEWVAGADVSVPAFSHMCGIEDATPGLRRAQVLAPLVYEGTETWTKDDYADLRTDRQLGRAAQSALFERVHTYDAPMIDLEKR